MHGLRVAIPDIVPKEYACYVSVRVFPLHIFSLK